MDPTKRFSNRVENYIRYRPGYPCEIVDLLKSECGLSPASVVADAGSGTGLLAELFLANGNLVYGIEPNREMREAGERLLSGRPRFKSMNSMAESTGLPAESVDFVTAGQAFHWFDRAKCRDEFKRILRPRGWVALVWNDRRTDSTPFLMEYEQLLQTFSTDYTHVDHKRIDANVLREFFRTEPHRKSFPNHQHCDYAFLEGRLLSSSYVPAPSQPRHAKMIEALKLLFDKHQNEGRVTLELDAVVNYGRFPGA
jgi:SAM-dependent methyltransferase